MSALGRWVFGNWPLKLTALGLATVLYAGLALSGSTRTWTGPVPIEVLNPPAGGALLDDPGVVEAIEYRASQEVADQLSNDSFRASIDLSGVVPRVGAIQIEVPVDVFPLDPRVRVVDYAPPGVTVRLDQVVSRDMPVVIDHGVVPEGIELGPVLAEPNRVTVSGASSRLQNVRSVEGRIVVDASGINIDDEVTLEAFDEVGVTVPGVEIDPGTVRVRADVARQLAFATLPVLPQLTGEPAPGMRVDNVSVVPAAVTVGGESPAVRQLEAISTAPVDISGQEVELVVDVPIVLPDEVTSRGAAEVTVLVTFTESQGSRAFEVGTAIVGARPGHTYGLQDPSVRIVVTGSLRQLDELDLGELIAEIPVGELEVGDHAVGPVVRPPHGLRVLRVDPATVRVSVARPT